VLLEVSKNLPEPMRGIDVDSLRPEERMQTRGV